MRSDDLHEDASLKSTVNRASVAQGVSDALSADQRERESGPTYGIRELCDIFEVTPRALRFYEDQGLIAPTRCGQQRIYSARDKARITLILRGKRFGFSLAEVRELLDLYDVDDSQVTQLQASIEKGAEKLTLLKVRQADIAAAIDDLERQIALIERMLAEREQGGEGKPAE